jgi:hypothetical protein
LSRYQYPKQVLHRLENPTVEPIQRIEVQTGAMAW